MTIAKKTVYEWLKSRTEPATFRQICDQFPLAMCCDISEVITDLIKMMQSNQSRPGI